MNLVFIMFDDLRPELSVYGRPYMITPNFERLARRSVVFDKAITQIAVCNPARDSLLTGLRPDTVGTYSFQSNFRPHYVFQNQLVLNNYVTAGYGKIAHWEGDDKEIWSSGFYEGDWYDYQNVERRFMNSSTMPDKVWPEEKFRDHMFTTKAITRLEEMIKDNSKKFMLALGLKGPHLQIHIPYKYYEMYKNRTDAFKLTKKESRFPHSSPAVAYRCCAEGNFMYMEEEGAVKAPPNKVIQMGDINMVFSEKMREELMIGYAAYITFVDVQLGRLLDVMDKHNAWKNTVVVLSADHGMHNGEKGIWEKWSMFDESTRVPLFIYHPDSPFKGKHYQDPVETIDIFPTITDLLALEWDNKKHCKGEKSFGKNKVCHDLQGKSLARVVLGDEIYKSKIENSINHKNNLNRQTKIRKRVILEGQDKNLIVMPVLVRRSLRSNDIKEKNDIVYKDTLNYYYKQWHMSDTNTNSSTMPAAVAKFFSGDNYFYLNSISYHNSYKESLTLNDNVSYSPQITFTPYISRSLAEEVSSNFFSKYVPSTDPKMPKLDMTFALSQSWRCAFVHQVKDSDKWYKDGAKGSRPRSSWFDCDKTRNPDDEIAIMGYSMRTPEYRYTAWFHYNRKLCLPILDVAPFDEELYDHRGESYADFTHLEIMNLVRKKGFEQTLVGLRMKLTEFIKSKIVFRGCFKDGD